MEASVGILILNYHQPEATLACVRRLLERESGASRILWIEHDAHQTLAAVEELLAASGLPWVRLEGEDAPLPPAGTLGLLPVHGNLGYAGGNNVGARFMGAHGVPWLWILNNDTLLESGTSADLVRAAQARPEVGVWGTTIRSRDERLYSGGLLRLHDFSIQPILAPDLLETNPLAFVSGCSLFTATPLAQRLGFLPEDYFLYYEDPAYTQEVRRVGLTASACLDVVVFHEESLSTGHRSPLMEYYSRRNRWAFIQRYFPGELRSQRRKAWYRFQSLLFRLAFTRAWVEWLALRDWKAGHMGRTDRPLRRRA